MIANPLELPLVELTDIQRRAVDWGDGPLLVLAGPGAGKTRVLTCRIARLLDSSRDRRFRILALTFTNKAANEMAGRVTNLVPGLEERADINTFHGFCTQVLRQHGVHLGIKSNFAIYSQTSDRQAILKDALRRGCAKGASHEDIRLLPVIDYLKARLVDPEQTQQHVQTMSTSLAQNAGRIAHVYRLYEDELRRANALDSNSLIFEVYRLFAYPAMSWHYQKVYRYWMIGEFQDTSGAQYALLKRMAGQDFRRIFAVADDDQTISEWNGANVRRIAELVRDFSCDILQLPTNFRCPPHIVNAANRLVVYNAARVRTKQPAAAVPHHAHSSGGAQIRCCVFNTDADEAVGIANEIARLDGESRSRAAVLARNRWLLEQMHKALDARGVSARITTRRDDFVSPQMRWLVACLRQISRPLDRRNMAVLVNVFNGFAQLTLDWDELASRSETDGVAYLTAWTDAVRQAKLAHPVPEVVKLVADLANRCVKWRDAIQQILDHFKSDDSDEDVREDLNAWRRISKEIKTARGALPLDGFLQELQLRSKEPVPVPGTVSLTTIHGAKGLESDTVYLIGLAEEILPSWQSTQKGNGSAAIEEERRECFVAITRTRKQLILSRAHRYRGWPKKPSRFLKEMGCLSDQLSDYAGQDA